jgi:hypothetical protein
MRKLIIGVVLVTSISMVARAEEKAVSSVQPKIAISIMSDTERNMSQKTTTTEFGVAAEVQGFELSLLPKWSWDDSDISNIEFALGYTFEANNFFSITPYSKVNADKNLKFGDKIVGFKTNYKF